MKKGTINNWSIQPRGNGACICGTSEGHPDPIFFDGETIRTSVIVGGDPENKTVLTNSGSIYQLGTVDPDYEAEFPDALNRFLKNLAEAIVVGTAKKPVTSA